MEPLKISKYPNGILRKKCASVERVADSERKLFEEMLFAMRHFAGIGLAAPQIGIARNLIVADIGEGAVRLANPAIVETKGSGKMEEGCLSVPGVGVVIDRPEEIVVKGLNEKGRVVEWKARGLLARVLQHEIDHLNGRLIVDYLNLLERLRLRLHPRKGRRADAHL